MKSLLRACVMALAGAGAAVGAYGAERISVDEVVNHYPWDGKVDCVTTVSGLDAASPYRGVFTLSVRKGGETVRRAVTNDLASVDGTYTNTFDCTALFGEGLYPNGGIAVDLLRDNDRTGQPIGLKGDVLIIDISSGSTSTNYPTTELTGVDLGTFNCDVYKTDKIVLLKVPAGTYYCEPGVSPSFARTLAQQTTKGFSIGVFPITQRQYERVMGTNPSYFTTDIPMNIAAHRPVESISWNTIRGGVAAGTEITASSPDSFLKRLVERTGLSGFDLPTEAQWEIAACANYSNTYGAYWEGRGSRLMMRDATNSEAAWNFYNAFDVTYAVGEKRPNLWGLFDTLGNVYEWCRDVYIESFNASYIDTPCTETSYYSGEFRVIRGGCYGVKCESCSSVARSRTSSSSDSDTTGFRLSRTLP